MDYESCKYVEGFVDSIIYRNEDNGYTVFDIVYRGEDITCVGTFSYISAGEFITARGEFVKHPVYYMQFAVKSYEFKAPDDEKSVRRYLSSGAIRGIKEKTAEKIVNKFGDDTFRILEEEPERLAEIKGISLNKAMDIANQIVEKKDMRKAMIFLQDFGISMSLSNKIYSQYGPNIYTIIKENPYKLADDIDGVGFKIADEIAVRVGINVDSDFRVKSAIQYVLTQSSMQGHVYLPKEILVNNVKALLLIDIPDIDHFLMDLAIDKKIVIKQNQSGDQLIYASMFYYMEVSVASMLKNLQVERPVEEIILNDRIKRIEAESGITLDERQKEAVKEAVTNGFMVITGGPGTGKTTTINTIIRYFEMEGMDIRLAAPTGRAAKRMSQTCGVEAQTIHRLLEVSPMEGDGLGSHFERDESNPLDTQAIIVDEMSMVDISIMCSLLKAIDVGTRLILVGDVDQLPSVGPGNVLKDIISAGCFPVVKLDKIFRQAAESDIITNAHKINRGESVTLSTHSKDFLFLRRESADEIIACMLTLIRDKLPKYVNADISEIQILTPSKKSNVGVERLNMIMQEQLNPPKPGKPEKKFANTILRLGDKVMQIKNNYQKEWEKRGRYGITSEAGTGVFNGDTGIIDDINEYSEYVQVKYDDDRLVQYDYKELDELELAYAITIHKSQGSEYPAVIIPMFQAPRMLMNRNLLYTAVTRARSCVCLVGLEDAFRQMAANESEQKRYSTLDERIKEVMGVYDDEKNKGILS